MIGDRLTQDFRLGARALRRAPAFSTAAVLTLALGIGVSAAVSTVAHTLLIRPLPVRDQDRVVVLWGATSDGRFDNYPLPLDDAREFGRRSVALARTAFFAYEGAWPRLMRDGDRASRLRQALVSGDFFDVLGVQAVLGRTLRPADDVLGAEPVVVLSDRAWQRSFGGDRDVVGRRLAMQETGVVYTVVGVMPRGLDYPAGSDFWAAVVPAKLRTTRDSTFSGIDMIGRLAPGAIPADARAELTSFYQRPGGPAWQRDLHGVAHTLPRLLLGDTRPAVFVFAAASTLLLLITCINVAGLLLVRGMGRARDVAVRRALGAGRRGVLRQLLAESLLLGFAGGALGLAAAAAAVRGFVALAPVSFPRLDEIHPGVATVAAAATITTIAVLLFAWFPAAWTSRVDLQRVLRSSARQSAGRRSRLVMEGLAAGQVALALMVLSIAGLLARSLIRLERVDLSLEPSHLLIAELAVRQDRYDDVHLHVAMLQDLVPRLEALPGVVAASPVVAVPFSASGGWDGRPAAEGQSDLEAAANPMLNMELVGPGYFTTLGTPVLRGRGFTDADRAGSLPVVVLSESAARHYWEAGIAIGKRLRMGAGPDSMVTVVGIVPDTRYRDLRDARASIYFPLAQSEFPYAPTTLAIRTVSAPATVVPGIRRVIRAEPGVDLADAAPFNAWLARPLAQPQLNALLLAVFAAAALALAVVGLFAVVLTMVRTRTREIGVRLALGGTPPAIQRMILKRGLAIAGIGVVAGLIGALFANRLLGALLWTVSPTDVPVLGLVTTLLLTAAGLAALIPARSSTHIDPLLALRAED